jgi:hypothetical protein
MLHRGTALQANLLECRLPFIGGPILAARVNWWCNQGSRWEAHTAAPLCTVCACEY